MTESWISCEQVIERLFEYMDRELDDHTSAEIERHLERCHDCFSRAEFERRLREQIAESGQQQAPEHLRLRIRDMLERF